MASAAPPPPRGISSHLPLSSPTSPGGIKAPMAPGTPKSPKSPGKPRVKKKVRMQEIVMDEDLHKPVDTFHLTISDVRAVLPVVEPRPVLLTFEFDNYWYAETNVYSKDVEPRWGFNAASIRGHDGRKPVPADGETNLPRRPGVLPQAQFIYETEFGYKLHKKYLIVKLAERSPYGDVEWGSAVVPLDSIARGCQATDLTIIGKDGVTCYGHVSMNIAMVNVQKVRAHITDLRLSGYPEAYSYDVKLVYVEFGLKGFEDGYNRCTEKRSDAEPRYSAQPALEWKTSLRDMLSSSASAPGSSSLKIYFSVHRQVARNRTEEIGVGALPVRMLFSKVTEGWMDLPTKFKVPLANYKGVIRGKVLLRNIPQFSQIEGDDLRSVDGTVMPLDVDLNSRKLLPWVKLPRSREARNKSSHATVAKGLGAVCDETVPAKAIGSGNGTYPIDTADATGVGQYHSSVTESTSDNGSDASSVGALPLRRRAHAQTSRGSKAGEVEASRAASPRSDRHEGSAAVSESAPRAAYDQILSPGISPHALSASDAGVAEGKQRDEATTVTERTAFVGTSHKYEWMRGIREDEESDYETEGVPTENSVAERVPEEIGGGARSKSQTRRDAQGPYDYLENGGTQWEDNSESNELSSILRERRSRSGKSVGSAGTADGGVEVGSAVVSMASDDGFVVGSRTTTEDAMTLSQRFSTGPPSEERYEIDDDRDESRSGRGGNCSFGSTNDPGVSIDTLASDSAYRIPYSGDLAEADDEEWMAVHDAASSRFYFAHKVTQESLWLPPEWERMVDEDGRQYFVDHGSRETQRGFPAAEARAYRESVYTRS